MARATTNYPLVSVIIPCYNHGVYLHEALASIWQQQYPAIEIVVVDDGSTDDTRAIVQAYSDVKYVYQSNKGLSAARNTGVAYSAGQYLVFLDADDWLLPNALMVNEQYLQQNPALAFVSGGHTKVFVATGTVIVEAQKIATNHYFHLLCGNYIGMHAAVMYQRWVFEKYKYDQALKACEDYDLYLHIARAHPVAHHTKPVAAYRLHNTNMSGNTPLMRSTVLAVLERQRPQLRDSWEEQGYTIGHASWQAYYSNAAGRLANLQANATPSIPANSQPTSISSPPSLPQAPVIKKILKNYAPGFGLRLLHQANLYNGYIPAVGRVTMGDFARCKPFSTNFGYDRGGPIDRYYIENFLQKEAPSIKGRVLEIGDNSYTMQYGSEKVSQSDILHIDASNPKATFIGDLSSAPQVPNATFDCLIITQTLHLIYDFKGALQTCYRILKPGGTLLLTAPGITPIDKGEWKDVWYWAFTDKALHRLMRETFPDSSFEISSFGNVRVATAYLYGMGLPEIDKESLEYYDPQFQVINAIKAVKHAALA
jgi:hypothetical protein